MMDTSGKHQNSAELQPVSGGVCAPRGFLAAGVHCGIKKENGDLALLYSEVEARAAGVFTTNLVKAAPVLLTWERVRDGRLQAVVVNSGNANACTGPLGMENAKLMARITAQELGLKEELVGVASTGVIGVPLPMNRVEKGIKQAVKELSPDGGTQAAKAIMTTDTCPKEVAVRVEVGGTLVTVGGMAKGSGMIHPNMATMLAFITSDARIDPGLLREVLKEAVERTFNMITVDGDTSTNDMVLMLNNGQAGNPEIKKRTPGYQVFSRAVEYVCTHLAKTIARDGEGATKLLEVVVNGAATTRDAQRAARAVAASNLVKTAVFGADANWGRVMCALGYSGANFNPDKVGVWIGPVKVVEGGRAAQYNEEEATRALQGQDVVLRVDLGVGNGQATAWGCDLSYDYVRINGSYRS